jgi:galactokinase
MKKQNPGNYCVYGYFGKSHPDGFGIIKEENELSVLIMTDEQGYSPHETWEKSYVERFQTLEEAIKYFIKETKNRQDFFTDRTYSKKDIESLARRKFPSYFQKT